MTPRDPGKPYYVFNREERHLAAILFHLLNLDDDAVKRFCSLIDCKCDPTDHWFGIYFEYSYLRDRWKKLSDNAAKRQVVLDMLERQQFTDKGLAQLRSFEKERDFNGFFFEPEGAEYADKLGRRREPSINDIESPGNWQLDRLRQIPNLTDGDFEAICKLKWAFKIKPDILIQTTRKHAICMEIKLESPPSTYRARGKSDRVIEVGQVAMQTFMLTNLLDIGCTQIVLSPCHTRASQKEARSKAKTVSWAELLEALKGGRFLSSCLERALGNSLYQRLELTVVTDHRATEMVKVGQQPDNLGVLAETG